MSERYSASVDSYAEAPTAAVAERAGLSESGTQSGIASARTALRRLAKRARERARELETAGPAAAFGQVGRSAGVDGSGEELIRAQGLLSALKDPEFALLRDATGAETEENPFADAERKLFRLHEITSATGETWEPAGEAAAEVRDRLERAIERGAARLAGAEAQTLLHLASGALEEMSYSVEGPERSRSGTLFLRGEGGDGTTVYVAVDEATGRLEFDFSGFRGTACAEARRRLVDALARRGVRLREVGCEFHGRPEGGQLARGAAFLFEKGGDSEEERRRRIRTSKYFRAEGAQ